MADKRVGSGGPGRRTGDGQKRSAGPGGKRTGGTSGASRGTSSAPRGASGASRGTSGVSRGTSSGGARGAMGSGGAGRGTSGGPRQPNAMKRGGYTPAPDFAKKREGSSSGVPRWSDIPEHKSKSRGPDRGPSRGPSQGPARGPVRGPARGQPEDPIEERRLPGKEMPPLPANQIIRARAGATVRNIRARAGANVRFPEKKVIQSRRRKDASLPPPGREIFLVLTGARRR